MRSRTVRTVRHVRLRIQNNATAVEENYESTRRRRRRRIQADGYAFGIRNYRKRRTSERSQRSIRHRKIVGLRLHDAVEDVAVEQEQHPRGHRRKHSQKKHEGDSPVIYEKKMPETAKNSPIRD